MPINWKSAESQERLLACILASFEPAKPNLHRAAELFGQGLKHGALSMQMGNVRKLAKKLVDEAESGSVQDAPAAIKVPTRGSAKGKKEDASKTHGVINGRVEKKPRKAKTTKSSRSAVEDAGDDWFHDAHTGMEDGSDANHGIDLDKGAVYESVEPNFTHPGMF